MKKFELIVSKEMIAYDSSIRSRENIVIIVLKVMSYMQGRDPSKRKEKLKENEVEVILNVDKMSRIFLVSDKKIHSFHFPFSIRVDNNELRFFLRGAYIDYATISYLLTVYERVKEFEHLISFYDEFQEVIKDFKIEEAYILFLSHLLGVLQTFELGYVRYDYDEERVNGNNHPLNHLDINLSNPVIYKIGLENDLNYNKLEDLLDVSKDCKFIKNY